MDHASLKSLCHAHCCLVELKNDFLILLWLVGGVLLGAGYSLEVVECIAEFLVGRKLTKLSYSAWLRFN